jgi:RNA polymerase sigma-70 factor (ECF subfamily)
MYYMILLVFLTDQEFGRLANGDPEIIGKLYTEYQKAITTYFLVKTFGNRTIAEDLVHETFCSIIKSVQRLTTQERLSFWIFTIAKRTMIKYQRNLFRQKKYMNIVKEQCEKPPDLDESIQKKQKLLLFKMAVESLPLEYKSVFNLRYDECNSVKQIAEKTGKTEKCIENLLRRIKIKLKKRMLAAGSSFFSEGRRNDR